jgi:hypothetical protein
MRDISDFLVTGCEHWNQEFLWESLVLPLVRKANKLRPHWQEIRVDENGLFHSYDTAPSMGEVEWLGNKGLAIFLGNIPDFCPKGCSLNWQTFGIISRQPSQESPAIAPQLPVVPVLTVEMVQAISDLCHGAQMAFLDGLCRGVFAIK